MALRSNMASCLSWIWFSRQTLINLAKAFEPKLGCVFTIATRLLINMLTQISENIKYIHIFIDKLYLVQKKIITFIRCPLA